MLHLSCNGENNLATNIRREISLGILRQLNCVEEILDTWPVTYFEISQMDRDIAKFFTTFSE